jgi:ABC-2 type transport system permease protein
VRDVRLAVFDGDASRASRQLVDVFSAAQYFKPFPALTRADATRRLDAEHASAALIIEPDFGKDAASGKSPDVQILMDGADNTIAGVIGGYLAGIQRSATETLLGTPLPTPIRLDTRFLFNPELNSRWFIIPGLVVIVIGLLSTLLTALTVAREWENGSMELLLSTPVEPADIILGKLAPYLVLGIASVTFVYVVARVVFHVPFVGSHLLFALAGLLFLCATLAQGLMISVVTRQQALAMQISIMSGLLPSMLLSGFIFPIESMPTFFRYFTAILPARWFMAVARGVFLKGAGWGELMQPLCMLALLGTLLIIMATKRFKRDLEP